MKRIALAAAASLTLAGGAIAQAAPAQDAPRQTTESDTPRIGGYAPAASPFSAPPTPGAKIVFVPNPQTPTEAFPPPPPRPEYPICKKGQTDGCRQRGGR